MNRWPLILVVDDSSTDVQIISAMLNSEYRIKVTNNGLNALAIAQRIPQPDLVLLDIIMPDMDGFEVCKQLKASPLTRDIPVIFLTAVCNESQEAKALNLQAADYVTKPYSVAVARARIRNKLRARPESVPRSLVQNQPALPAWHDLSATDPVLSLSKRETEILGLIAQGLTSQEISANLHIAKGTVEVHREHIMRKLGVRNIVGLVKIAMRCGLMAP
jgi:DNA-binding NarL/FixJ family response regulator